MVGIWMACTVGNPMMVQGALAWGAYVQQASNVSYSQLRMSFMLYGTCYMIIRISHFATRI